MAIDPRIRDSAGQFSAKGTLSARSLRKAWRIAPRSAPPPKTAAAQFSAAVTGTLLEFDAVPSTFTADKIDTVNAVIRGVSVITSGLIARGHNLEVDGVTLNQMQACAVAKGQVPVKVDHKSGAAAVCGYLENFRQEEGKLKADWHLLESHPQKAQILEVARRMPRGVGLSASFVSPDKPERSASGKAAARCIDLISVDYVTLPAANPNGMFAAKVDSPNTAMTPEQIAAAIKQAVAEAIAPITAELAQTKKQLELATNPPSLEEVAGMDEAQLAELGLTKADVQRALEDAAAAEAQGAEGDGSDGDGSAEGATDGASSDGAAAAAAAAAAGAATGFEALSKQIVELSAEIKALKGQKIVDAETALVESLETNFEALSKENEALRQALAAGGPGASPGVDRNNIRFFSADKDKGEFENLVQFEIEQNKLPKAKAFAAVIAARPDAHREYLIRSGVLKAE